MLLLHPSQRLASCLSHLVSVPAAEDDPCLRTRESHFSQEMLPLGILNETQCDRGFEDESNDVLPARQRTLARPRYRHVHTTRLVWIGDGFSDEIIRADSVDGVGGRVRRALLWF
jgi:hypothetical protein